MVKPRRKRPKGAELRKGTILRKEERRKKRIVIGGGLFMAFLMIFGIVGVINYNPAYNTEVPMTYGDYEFTLETRSNGGQVLVTDINGQQVEFQSLPAQVAYFEVDPAAIELMKSSQNIALLSDPEYDEYNAGNIDYARLQMSLALRKTANGMLRDNEFGLPVLGCENATSQTPMFVFNLTNETARLTVEDNCITMSAAEREMMLMKDRIIFEYYGMMDYVEQETQ